MHVLQYFPRTFYSYIPEFFFSFWFSWLPFDSIEVSVRILMVFIAFQYL